MLSPLLLGDVSSLTSSWRSCLLPGHWKGPFWGADHLSLSGVTAVPAYLGDEQGFGFWGLGSVALLEDRGTGWAHRPALPRQHGEEEQPVSTCPQPWVIPGGAETYKITKTPQTASPSSTSGTETAAFICCWKFVKTKKMRSHPSPRPLCAFPVGLLCSKREVHGGPRGCHQGFSCRLFSFACPGNK